MTWNLGDKYTGSIVTPEQTSFELVCDSDFNTAILIKLKNTKHLLAACVVSPEHLVDIVEFIKKVEAARQAARRGAKQ